jgi:hypothetical protein
VTRNPDRNLLLQEEVHTLLQKGTVELVNPPLTPGYYSLLFLVPKKNGKMRPVIDLSVLNQHLIVPHFKMETNRSIRGSIRLGMWTTSLDLTDAYFHIPISPKFRKFLRFVWEDRVYAFKAMPFGLSTAPLVFTRVFQEVVAHLHSQSILIHFFLFGRFLIEKYVPISTQTGFPNFMEEVGASSQPRPHFSRGTLSDTSGASFSHRGKHFNSTITGEQICSGIVSNSSSIFTADRFSDFSDGCYSSRPSTYTPNSVVPEGVLASSYSNVGGLYSCSSQTTASSSVVVTEVQPFDRCTSERPRIHTDSLHRCLPNRMGCLPRRENSVRGVGRLSFRRAHKSSGNEGSSTVMETLPRSDSKTVSVDSQRQYDSGGLSSESGENSLLFSISSMKRNSVAMRQSPDSVDRETCPGQSESNSGCVISIPCSSEYGMGVSSSNFSSNHSDLGSPPDRSVCHQFELQTGDICISNPRPESLGSGCNDSWKEMFNYIFPPFRLLHRILHKMREDGCKTILIAPAWSRQSWFPDLLLLSCAKPLRLPLRGDLLSQFKGKKLHQGLEKLHLHAWLLSGRLSDREAFLKKQPSASLEQL